MTGRRTWLGLVAALLVAVLLWWSQGDGATPDAGGPYPYDQGDGAFGTFEEPLPEHERGHYRENTVQTSGPDHRGARRIVAGSEGELYWTSHHYQSFERITR